MTKEPLLFQKEVPIKIRGHILISLFALVFVCNVFAEDKYTISGEVKFQGDPINQWLLELRFAGISTIMLHHTNKEGGQRGTSAREDISGINSNMVRSRSF